MEELFLKLQRNKVTMTVRPVKGPYQHCQLEIRFSKEVAGKECADDLLIDTLDMREGSHHYRMIDDRLDYFIRQCRRMSDGIL